MDSVEMSASSGLPFLRRANPFIQNLLIAALLFCNPGLYLAITGLGAGGGKATSITMADTSNAVLYGVFSIVALFTGTLINLLGPRLTAMIASIGYPIYTGSMWYYDTYGNMWFPVFAGAILGVSGACLWTTANFVANSYSEENNRGTWRAIQICGSCLGSLVQVYLRQSPFLLERDFQCFLIELYAYVVLVANVSPGSLSEAQKLEYDSFLLSLQTLRDCDTFGVILGRAHHVFELIPPVHSLGKKRLQEQEQHQWVSYCSPASASEFLSLERQIRCWDPPEDADTHTKLFAHIYQRGLLAFLYTSFYGRDLSNLDLLRQLDRCIDDFLPLLLALPVESPSNVMIGWPLLIVSSCIRSPESRQIMRNQIHKIDAFFNTAMGPLMDNLLESLWAMQPGEVFGPLGLEAVMKRENVSFGII